MGVSKLSANVFLKWTTPLNVLHETICRIFKLKTFLALHWNVCMLWWDPLETIGQCYFSVHTASAQLQNLMKFHSTRLWQRRVSVSWIVPDSPFHRLCFLCRSQNASHTSGFHSLADWIQMLPSLGFEMIFCCNMWNFYSVSLEIQSQSLSLSLLIPVSNAQPVQFGERMPRICSRQDFRPLAARLYVLNVCLSSFSAGLYCYSLILNGSVCACVFNCVCYFINRHSSFSSCLINNVKLKNNRRNKYSKLH